ncbi:MAG: leucyl aminopeptidase family protein [Bacteroidota bacterium]
MTYNTIESIDPHQDLILAFEQNQVDFDRIADLTGVKLKSFEGAFGEYEILYSRDGGQVFLLGLGHASDEPRRHEAFRKLAFQTRKRWSSALQLDARAMSDRLISNAILGLELASYQIGFLKSTADDQERNAVTVGIMADREVSSIVQEAQQTATSINRVKNLVDSPSNVKTPSFLADWSRESAADYGYRCEVLEEEELERRGFGAIVAVGKGSIHPPRLIINQYIHDEGSPVALALVGKGITFDSGGISIKPSQNMHYMKSDMGGAAAVLGAVELAARLKLPINLVGVVAAAENAVDAKSFRPGDVITSYSGKTIEVIDTDAEGRLVLADAIAYTLEAFKPEYLIDLATLTGSVVRTLGYSAAGLFTENQEMADGFSRIGEDIHERVWRLPLYKEFEEDLHSDIADLRNFSNQPIAGAINAAKFLEAFTEAHPKWAHLDIAGMAFGSSEYAKMKSASGFGIRLLVAFMKSLTSK